MSKGSFFNLGATDKTPPLQPDIDDLKLCNCDGAWHVSVPDGDSFVTKYVDVTALYQRLAEEAELYYHPRKLGQGVTAVELEKLKELLGVAE